MAQILHFYIGDVIKIEGRDQEVHSCHRCFWGFLGSEGNRNPATQDCMKIHQKLGVFGRFL